MISNCSIISFFCKLIDELGMGIHGEPGAEKITLSTAETGNLTNVVIKTVCERLDAAIAERQDLGTCPTLAVMVNNLGTVSQAEMLIICQCVYEYLYNGAGLMMNGNHFDEVMLFSGAFMTSLDMNGASVTCFLLPNDNVLKEYLQAPTSCNAWISGMFLQPPSNRHYISSNVASGYELIPKLEADAADTTEYDTAQSSGADISDSTKQVILAITQAVIDNASELERLDRITGDGDLGDTGRFCIPRTARTQYHFGH